MRQLVPVGSSPLTRGKRVEPLLHERRVRLIPAHAGKTQELASERAAITAHPRSRGENLASASTVLKKPGSSPLTRGKRKGLQDDGRDYRLIPAHAGKTGKWQVESPPSPAHPRSRGENSVVLDLSKAVSGSSPLTRGKRRAHGHGHPPRRLIPAHAGKTASRSSSAASTAAHPRSRGENPREALTLSSQGGSSPLTRGKPRGRAHRPPSRRLIPAHAGKTTPTRCLG